ncbi:MAG: alpha/beta hydrolase [Gammaproteobacteria bacterium]|nr:alpha/beta hydrolase [Gammaproteobacteria bacterium]
MPTFPASAMIDTNGVSLEVFEQGAGKPVIMCHGWPEHAYSWRHQIPAVAAAGYHVIVPNQRGYGHSSKPAAVEAYDIVSLTGDLVGLLDHYGYQDALFVGHDWGAIVVWNMALLHPERVAGVINLSVPFMRRGTREWVEFWEEKLGPDFYIVHFNRQPGVAAAVFEANTENFLRNLYHTEQWLEEAPDLGGGMRMLAIAERDHMPGKLLMSEEELQVFVKAFKHSGFSGGINWYRNFTRNWHTLAAVEQRVRCPTLMIHGEYDRVPPVADLQDFVPNLEMATLDCGHWIMQERPAQTNELILGWLPRHYPA